MARDPLTSEERHLLTDSAALAEAVRRGPVVIAGRAVEGLTIPALSFVGVTFRDVGMREVTFQGTGFRRCRFEDVTFDACDLETPAFVESELTNVRMGDVRLREARFEGCHLQGLRTSLCQLDAPRITDCKFDGLHDRNGEILDATLTRVSFAGAVLTTTAFRRAAFEQVTFEGGRLERVRMSLLVAGQLVLRQVELAGLEIEGGRIDALTLDEVRGLGFRSSDVQLGLLRLVRAGELTNVIIAGDSARQLVIEDCPTLQMVVLGHCTVTELQVLRSSIAGLYVRNARLGAGGLFQSSLVDGFHVNDTEADGLTLRDVSVATRLDVAGSRFRGLRLIQVQYASPLLVVRAGATFQQGDSFPAR